jgi:hypothetical protein
VPTAPYIATSPTADAIQRNLGVPSKRKHGLPIGVGRPCYPTIRGVDSLAERSFAYSASAYGGH